MIAFNEIKEQHGIEMAVVIVACRVHFETATGNELQEIINNYTFNWQVVLKICRAHRIRPIVYKILSAIKVPSAIYAIIKQEYVAIVARNWELARETERLILLLKEKGVQAVPYKGVAFSLQFYGDLISRESSDIDLVISPADLNTVIEIMKREEYLPEQEEAYKYLDNTYFKYFKDYNFNKFKLNNGRYYREFHIEFHWRVAEGFLGLPPQMDDYLFNNYREGKIINHCISFLNPAAHYLCMLIHHSIKDQLAFIRNLIDLSQFKEMHFIAEETGTLKQERVLNIASCLINDVFGINLYPQKNDSTANAHKKSLDKILALKPINVHNIMNRTFIKQQLAYRNSLKGKLSFLSAFIKYRFIPGPKDIRIIKFPKKLFFLYFFFKPFRSLISPANMDEEKQRFVPKTYAGEISSIV